MSSVVHQPPSSLPAAASLLSTGQYALPVRQHVLFEEQLRLFRAWSQSSIELSRPGPSLAHATVENTVRVARCYCGWVIIAVGKIEEPSLRWFLDGRIFARYMSWSCDVRKKKPSSLAWEVNSSIRLVDFVSTLEPGLVRSDLESLKHSMRRMASQFLALCPLAPCISDLEASGKWVDLKRVQCAVRAEAEAVLHSAGSEKHNAALARRVHDSLLACMAIVDSAPQRPGCLRVVRAALPKRVLSRCCLCSAPLCLGNRFEGDTLILVHSKTSRHREPIRVDFAGTLTARLLKHHVTWGRAALANSTESLWLTSRGDPFASDVSFAAYLPRKLECLGLPRLTFTALRHIAIVGVSEWSTSDELEGMANAIGTSMKKIKELYDYRQRQRSTERFLNAYRASTII